MCGNVPVSNVMIKIATATLGTNMHRNRPVHGYLVFSECSGITLHRRERLQT